MITRGLVAIGLLAVSNGVNAQTAPPAGTPGFEDMLAGQSVLKMNGACNRLTTPEGDRTPECDKQLINIAFASGNSTFLATMEGKGSISFRGRDSAARGDVATIALRSVILTGTDLSSPPVEIKAKGQCTYTNPHKGPIQVECSANTAKGKYELSYVSDGVWPPK
ncbi:hypothetical protein OMP43_04080 [Sphingomonas sp. CBMAI 2297]|uniref:hypothetical protein n=1 Tax=Sphingomonas sp. CBMAI 2297 TaxID=2991720 RepID=UPI0024546A19|nr:hypothetical protein [Sphingomonas sp. CBMAI 2297]MDH4743191.1 hypothetical protein [Sphingomonas sp. CBMAI 2297]